MIVSVFVRRLKPGCTFADFVREWEADRGFGVPTRVFNALSLDDPRDVITIGLVDVPAEDVAARLAEVAGQERVRHDRIDTVIESTTLRCMYDLRSEHDFTDLPARIEIGSPASLLSLLAGR
jgi:hypothetical protein